MAPLPAKGRGPWHPAAMTEPLTLERALEHLGRGDWEDAARASLALLAGDPEHPAAGTILLELLRQRGRSRPRAGHRLGDRFLRRGEVAAAAHAALLDEEDPTPFLEEIARALGEGSKRLATGAPPPLPGLENTVDAAPPQLAGEALLDAAEDALDSLLELPDPAPDGAAVPSHPLFSTLRPGPLASLMGRFTPVSLPRGAGVLRQGEHGEDAFLVVRGRVDAVRELTDGEQHLAQLGSGAIFGELGLVAETPRAATVRSATAAQLLRVRRSDLEDLGLREVTDAWIRFTRARLIDHLVRSSPLFRDLDGPDVQSLVQRFETRAFEPGELVLRRGDPGEALHLVASGSFQVSGPGETEGADERAPLARVGPGDVVGEMALVLRRPVGADVRAETSAVTLALSRAAFEETVRDHPTLLRELYETARERDDELTRSLLGTPGTAPDGSLVL